MLNTSFFNGKIIIGGNMKKLTYILTIICSLTIILIVINLNRITNYLSSFFNSTPKITINSKNKYALERSFGYVQTTDDYVPLGEQDLKNIIYTAVDAGLSNITFYCPKEYTNCVKDITKLTNDQETLTHINNFVSPYNSFSNIKTSISESGEISIKISYLYTEDEIEKINSKIDEIIKKNITNDMDDYDKIKAIHDYLINNSKYDVERNDGKGSKYNSYKALGPLFEGYATCNGYTDAMALFLNKFGIKNYKIATTPDDHNLTGHIWNAVYINNKWSHLDVTWDDPVSESGQDYLLHKYLLITNDELKKADEGKVVVTEHNFKKSIYQEFE